MLTFSEITKTIHDKCDVVAHEVDQTDGMSLSDLAKYYFALKAVYEDLDAARKRMYHLVDKLNKFTIPERLEREDLDKIQVPDIARSFYILPKVSAKVQDKDKLKDWLVARGDGDLVQETVNAGTLAAHLRKLLEDQGVEAPVDVVVLNTYNTTGMSKYTPK